MRRRACTSAQAHRRKAACEVALERLRGAGIDADAASPQTLAHGYISPVLTAHPTEVQRKSILDAERAIAELLAGARDQGRALRER